MILLITKATYTHPVKQKRNVQISIPTKTIQPMVNNFAPPTSSTLSAPMHTSRQDETCRPTWVPPKTTRRLQTHPHIVKSRRSHILNKCRSFQLMVSLHLLVTVLSFYITIFFHLDLISPSSALFLARLLFALLRSTQQSTQTLTRRSELSLNASPLIKWWYASCPWKKQEQGQTFSRLPP